MTLIANLLLSELLSKTKHVRIFKSYVDFWGALVKMQCMTKTKL